VSVTRVFDDLSLCSSYARGRFVAKLTRAGHESAEIKTPVITDVRAVINERKSR
jgi:hypothetical protein